MKDSFIIEGKKYISSRRASAISDYASDYIGQLCRSNKLDCRMIGRSWFVTEESLYLHKANISREEASRNRIENLKGPIVTDTKSAIPVNLPTEISSSLNTNIPVSLSKNYIYSADDRPLLPSLRKVNTTDFDKKVVTSLELKKVSNAVTPSKVVVSNIQKDNQSIKLVTSDVTSKKETKFSRKVFSYPEIARSIILKRVIAPVFVIVIFFGLGTTTYIVANKVGPSIASNITTPVTSASVGLSNAFNFVFGNLRDGYNSVVAFFTSPAKLAMDIPKEFGNVSVSGVTPNGIVLSSSTGSDYSDEILKSKIAESFSDEVVVNPDKSGTAGVITPVFKDTKGKDFVYVMVPVKDKGETKIQ